MSEPIVIVGLDGLGDDLEDLAENIVRVAFPEALKAGGKVIEGELRRRTPHSDDSSSSKEYGHTVDDIDQTVKVDPQRLTGSARIGFAKTGYKARFQEFGFTDTSHDGKPLKFVPAKPFIRPAAEAAGDAACDAFESTLADNIR